ncbi:FmdB family zinc ribbon protein [Paraburkholderia sp. SOS3]|jgi:putative FmdB family regulatory protein|uniref:FmdB family zinc ribbon protein n=1 Tax=Paraburkholderia sp. SOS3 TaxID=1926494 RepID=UPI0009474B86|nr:FmdB family zinc ribbon protein [Paraburkholderia sp. SOS3]APR34552.1 FmdB family transcriptional regulator [Paraburkholderia sp. SOS3]
MPIYAYRCESCGFGKDVLQKLSDAPLTQCPQCGAETFRKQVTAAGFQLKGSGWYVTDFRGGNASNKSADGAGNGSNASGSDGKASSAGASSEGGKSGSSDSAAAASSKPAATPAGGSNSGAASGSSTGSTASSGSASSS